MYEAQTKAAILQRMLDASPPDIDKRQGSVTFDMLSPAAIELALLYVELDNVLRFGYVKEDGTGAYGTFLDLRAAERGLTRKAAAKAVGSVTFTGANGTIIPAGTEVSTGGQAPVYFVTKTAVTVVGGKASVAVDAKTAGAAGNVGPGAVRAVVGALSGVLSVTNATAFDGGSDAESDAALSARLLEYVRKPATSGNANQYRQWALSVAGISDAKVYPIWNGPGTVKVVLLDDDKTAPASSVVTEVANFIAGVRPVGATVTVVGATEVPINISGTYTLKAGAALADARAQIASGLTAYLKTLAFTDPIVRYTQIANVILNADAVVDYTALTVNGGTGNVTIADGSVAVKGSVT